MGWPRSNWPTHVPMIFLASADQPWTRMDRLVRERVGAKLEMQDLARCSFTTFRVKRSSRAVGCPQSFSLPANRRIVDPAVHPLRVESHGIRDTKHNKLPAVGQQRKERVISIACGNR